MSVKGLVLDERAYLGSVTPPDTFEDKSRFKNDGVHTDITWVKNPQGIWVRQFNGTSSLITIGSTASLGDIFDGGGSVLVWINPSSDGESNAGGVFDKGGGTAGWLCQVREEVSEFVKYRFFHDFTGQDGFWTTDDAVIPINANTLAVIVYDSDSNNNNPIIYLGVNGVITIYEIGSGLTESNTPTGTRVSDIAQSLIFGNNVGASATFDGDMTLARFYTYALSAEQIDAIFQSERHWFGV